MFANLTDNILFMNELTNIINRQTNAFKNLDLDQLTPRQLWLWENRIPGLVKKLKDKEQIDLSSLELFETLINSDPSSNNSAVQWLIESYMRDGFRWEDIQACANSKVSETLKLFGKLNKNLSVKERSLFNYQTIGDVYNAIKPWITEYLDNSISSREQKRQDKYDAEQQSTIIYDGPNFKIIVPKTQFAAKWWGKGTRWCTAAENNNAFEHYNQNAPLFVCIGDHEGKQIKAQFWTNGLFQIENHQINPEYQKYEQSICRENLQFQFMDASDNNATTMIDQTWPLFEPLLNWMLSKNYSVLKYYPKKHQTYEICYAAVKNDPLSFDCVRKDLMDKKLCLLAIKDTPRNIIKVPLELLDQQTVLDTIKKDPSALCYFDQKQITKEMYLIALKNNVFDLSDIPKQNYDQEICTLAVQMNSGDFYRVPDSFKNKDVYSAIIKHDGCFLKLVPEKFHTPQLYLNAVQSSAWAIDEIAQKDRTKEIILASVEKNGNTLKSIQHFQQDRNLCLVAVKNSGSALEYVPLKHRTYEICSIAVQGYGFALQYVPKNLIDYNLCVQAVKNDGYSITCLPDKFLNEELVDLAIESNPFSIASIPKEYLTNDLYRLAIEKDYFSIKDINTDALTEELVLFALKQGLKLIDVDIPDYFKSKNFYEQTIKINVENIRNVPESFLTNDFIFNLVKENPDSIMYVPERFQTEEIVDYCLKIDPAYVYQISNKELFHRKITEIEQELKQSKLSNNRLKSIKWNMEDVIQLFDNFADFTSQVNNVEMITESLKT